MPKKSQAFYRLHVYSLPLYGSCSRHIQDQQGNRREVVFLKAPFMHQAVIVTMLASKTQALFATHVQALTPQPCRPVL